MENKIDSQGNLSGFSGSLELQNDLINSTPRAAGIVGATAIEIYLECLLNAFLINDVKKINIRTFTLKIELCYNLGLISKDEYDDLHKVREIRNVFANDAEGRTFDEEYIKNICNAFAIIKKLDGNESLSIRMKYNVTIYTLEYNLKHRIADAAKEKRRPRKEITF